MRDYNITGDEHKHKHTHTNTHTCFLNSWHSSGVSVSALAMRGMTLTLSWSLFMNSMSSGFRLGEKQTEWVHGTFPDQDPWTPLSSWLLLSAYFPHFLAAVCLHPTHCLTSSPQDPITYISVCINHMPIFIFSIPLLYIMHIVFSVLMGWVGTRDAHNSACSQFQSQQHSIIEDYFKGVRFPAGHFLLVQ